MPVTTPQTVQERSLSSAVGWDFACILAGVRASTGGQEPGSAAACRRRVNCKINKCVNIHLCVREAREAKSGIYWLQLFIISHTHQQFWRGFHLL